MNETDRIILAKANEIAKLLKLPVVTVLKDIAKGKDSRLMKFLKEETKS